MSYSNIQECFTTDESLIRKKINRIQMIRRYSLSICTISRSLYARYQQVLLKTSTSLQHKTRRWEARGKTRVTSYLTWPPLVRVRASDSRLLSRECSCAAACCGDLCTSRKTPMLREQQASGTNRTRLVDFESLIAAEEPSGWEDENEEDDDNDEEQLEGRWRTFPFV